MKSQRCKDHTYEPHYLPSDGTGCRLNLKTEININRIHSYVSYIVGERQMPINFESRGIKAGA